MMGFIPKALSLVSGASAPRGNDTCAAIAGGKVWLTGRHLREQREPKCVGKGIMHKRRDKRKERRGEK